MIDDVSLLNVRRSERFRQLEGLVRPIPGQSDLVKRKLINFSLPTALDKLKKVIATCAVKHEEGLVLKADDPYFDFRPGRRRFSCCPIKYKTGYNPTLGEVGDFAVVGARYDPVKAKEYYDKIPNLANLKWTDFYLGCLLNKEGVQRRGEKPSFKVVAVVELSATNLRYFIHNCWTGSTSTDENEAIHLHLERGIDGGRRPSIIFTEPAVFDISSFNFHKEGNTNFWSPRWPSVTKVHLDRSYMDCLTFSELQEKAELEMAYVENEESQKVRQYIQRLKQGSAREIQAAHMESSSSQQSMTPPSQRPLPRFEHVCQPPVTETARPELRATGLPVVTVNAGPLTPPRSSLPEPHHDDDDDLVEITAKVFHARKRSRDTDKATPKRKQRRLNAGTPVSSSPVKPASQSRQPLGDITSSSQNALWTARPDSPVTRTSFLAPSTHPQRVSVKDSRSASSPSTTPSSACQAPRRVCALRNCMVLLSPCVAGLPLVTEAQKCQEAMDVFTDPLLWMNAYSRKIKGKQTGSSEIPKPRKFIMVDTKRNDATLEFLLKVEALDLKKGADKEWTRVYDWRLLQSMTMEDANNSRQNKREVWRKHLVGLI